MLTEAGLECGHEVAMPAPTPDGQKMVGRSYAVGEVSWAVAPYLHLLNMASVHVVRHPLNTIASLVQKKWMTSGHRPSFEAMFPGLYDVGAENSPEQCGWWWLRWTELADRADYRVRVEEPDLEVFWNVSNRSHMLVECSRASLRLAYEKLRGEAVGHSNDEVTLGWADLGCVERAVRQRAEEYGYAS